MQKSTATFYDDVRATVNCHGADQVKFNNQTAVVLLFCDPDGLCSSAKFDLQINVGVVKQLVDLAFIFVADNSNWSTLSHLSQHAILHIST